MAEDVDEFKWLFAELRARLKGPVGYTAVWATLIAGTIGLGGSGIWYEVLSLIFGGTGASVANVNTAMLTYFLAVAGSATLQLIFADVNHTLRAFGIVAVVAFTVLAVGLLYFKPENDFMAFLLGLIGSLLALVMWWLTAGQDPTLKAKIKPDAAVGGDPNQQPQGNLNGFKS